MSLPPIARHAYIPSRAGKGTGCEVCGCSENFGGLHTPVEPAPDNSAWQPDNSAWQPGDIVRNPRTGGIFAARLNYGRLEFLELYPTAAQDHAPDGAELLVRDGEVVR